MATQDERRDQARSCSAAAAPVEPDFIFVPVPDHPASLVPLTFARKPKVPSDNCSAYAACCTARRSEHAENLADLLLAVERRRASSAAGSCPAGVAGGRARLT